MISVVLAAALPVTPAGAAAPAASAAATSTAVSTWMLPDLDGVQHSLARHHGKWVVVNFWATWCAPCLEEMPAFEAEWAARRKQDLVVIGVAMDWDDPAEIRSFVRKREVDYPIVLGSDALADQIGSFQGLPATFIYDPHGRLVHSGAGKLTRADLQRLTGH